MRKICTVIGMLAAVAMCSGILNTAVLGAGKPAPKPNIPVSVTFRDAATDKIQSDWAATGSMPGSNPYVTAGGAQAYLGGTDGWLYLYTCVLGKNNQCGPSTRTVSYDFSSPFNLLLTPPASPTPGYGLLRIWAFSGSTQVGLTSSAVTGGAPIPGGMLSNFQYNKTTYTVRFMTPAFDDLTVTYQTPGTPFTAPGATWTVEGITDINGLGDVADLSVVSTDYGQFHMPFKMTITVLSPAPK